jgi:hypothetical protein
MNRFIVFGSGLVVIGLGSPLLLLLSDRFALLIGYGIITMWIILIMLFTIWADSRRWQTLKARYQAWCEAPMASDQALRERADRFRP